MILHKYNLLILAFFSQAMIHAGDSGKDASSMSMTKKLLVGGAVVVVGAGAVAGAIIAAPLVLPATAGAAVAAKTAAIIAAVKAAAATANSGCMVFAPAGTALLGITSGVEKAHGLVSSGYNYFFASYQENKLLTEEHEVKRLLCERVVHGSLVDRLRKAGKTSDSPLYSMSTTKKMMIGGVIAASAAGVTAVVYHIFK